MSRALKQTATVGGVAKTGQILLSWPLPFYVFSAKDIEDSCRHARTPCTGGTSQALHWANFAASSFLCASKQSSSVNRNLEKRKALTHARALLRSLGLGDGSNPELIPNLATNLASTLNRRDATALALMRMISGKPEATWPTRGLGIAPWIVAEDSMKAALDGLQLLILALETSAMRKRPVGPRPRAVAMLIKYLAISYEESTGQPLSITVTAGQPSRKDGEPSGPTFLYVIRLLETLQIKLRDRKFVLQLRDHLDASQLRIKISELKSFGAKEVGNRLRVLRRNRTELKGTI